MQVDGTNLLDGITGKKKHDGFEAGTVSIGKEDTVQKKQKTETWSKGEKTTEVIYHNPQKEEKGGTTEDVMQQAENIDAAQMKKQMVVASNTTTTTDCRQMEEDGFSLQQTDAKTIVTVTDKIKMQLAKAGVDISYFGDDLSAEQLEVMAGNAAMAQELAGMITQQQADVPLTEENLEDCVKAVAEAGELHPLSDGALKYMLDNQLEPTIANLYKAQYSGSAAYLDTDVDQIDFSAMEEQITRIIAQSGHPQNEQTISDSKWLIRNGIPLTVQSLDHLEQLKSMEFPLKAETMVSRMVTALSEGKRPQDAALVEGYSLKEQAQHVSQVISQATDEDLAYVVVKNQPVTIESLEQAHNEIQAGVLSEQEKQEISGLVHTAAAAGGTAQEDIAAGGAVQTGTTINGSAQPGTAASGSVQGNEGIPAVSDTTNAAGSIGPQYTDMEIGLIAARRQLEEIRLMMTSEVSYIMLKQGIEVNTSSMEELIQQLRTIEDNYYRDLLEQGGIEATEAKVSMFAETTDKIEELKGMPAYALGAQNIGISTLEGLHQEGSQMQQDFQQANQRYETMQTQPRADLGDNIQKAFENIEDILESIGMEATKENKRAVRILAYNRIEITPANMIRVKAADQQVQVAFRNMTPTVVREFIGRGLNPLDMDIRQLNRQIGQIRAELDIQGPEERFSEYLYKLEQNHSISQEERSSYIGIYRLINQVVQSDGAAVGALVDNGSGITMRNLLAAVRTQRLGKIDVTVDNSFGMRIGGGYVDSITKQIEIGYQHTCVAQAFDEISPERLRTVTEDPAWDNMTPEQFLQQIQEAPEDVQAEEAYYKQQLEQLSESAKASETVYQVLEQYNIPNSVANVMAVSELMQHRNDVYRRLFHMANRRSPDANISTEGYMTKDGDGNAEVDFDAIRAELLERFSEDIKKPEELAKAMAELAECAEKCMSTMIIEPDVSSLDIRSLKLMNAQISVNVKMASAECFSIPIVVDGEVTNVTLKIVRNKEQKGLVDITLETSRMGKIAAELKAKENGITGYIATDSRKTKDLLQSRKDEIVQSLKQEEGDLIMLDIITSTDLDLNHFAMQSGKSEEPGSEELREVQTKTLYGMAEGFIKIIKQLDTE